MKKLNMIKMMLNIVMTVIMILLMKISFVGVEIHELLGIGIFMLFLLHKALNYRWIVGVCRGILKNKVRVKAVIMILLDVLMLVFVSFILVTGVLISQSLFVQFNAPDMKVWSDLHHFAAYCMLMLISVHIGFHWQAITNGFKQGLGLTQKNAVRTVIARITLIVIAFIGIRAVVKPEIYNNFIAPFKRDETLLEVEKAKTTNYVNIIEDGSNDEDTMQLNTRISSIAEQITPTLEEYLGKLVCTSCGKRCPLTSLRCNRGTQSKDIATAEYQEIYGDAEENGGNTENDNGFIFENGTEDGAKNKNDNNFILDEESWKNGVVPDNSEDSGTVTPPNRGEMPSSPWGDSEQNDQTGDNSGNSDKNDTASTSAADYIALMGIVIAGVHYSITIPQRFKHIRL